MIHNGRPYCDECRGELKAWTREEAEENGLCGWSDWRSAHKHYCQGCYDGMFDKWAKAVGFPACGECETFPCKRGRECWDTRFLPLHIVPYETFFGELVGTDYPDNSDFDAEEPTEPEVLRTQRFQKAAHNKDQTALLTFFSEEKGLERGSA